MLALSDKDGMVSGSIPGLAHVAGVSVKQCEQAVNMFLEPDRHSRSSEHEGRRIEKVEGGWRLLNHAKYRHQLSKEEQREKNRVRQAEYRARNALSRDVTPVTQSNDIAEADTDAKAEANNKEPKPDVRKAAGDIKRALNVTGNSVFQTFCEVIENELYTHPKWTADQVSAAMIETRRNYEQMPEIRSPTPGMFIWPVPSFFSTGTWRQPEIWLNGHKKPGGI